MLGEGVADLGASGPGTHVDPVIALERQIGRHEGVGQAGQRRPAVEVDEFQPVAGARNDGGDADPAGRRLGVGGARLDHLARCQADQGVGVRVVAEIHARQSIAAVVVRRLIGVQIESRPLERAVADRAQSGEAPGLARPQLQRSARESAGAAGFNQHAGSGLEHARADGQVKSRLAFCVAPAQIAFLESHPTGVAGVEGVGSDGHRADAGQAAVEGCMVSGAALERHAGLQIGLKPFGVGIEVGDARHRFPKIPEQMVFDDKVYAALQMTDDRKTVTLIQCFRRRILSR
ncbi:hypothetical protein D3C73_949820 [compost metagenome]